MPKNTSLIPGRLCSWADLLFNFVADQEALQSLTTQQRLTKQYRVALTSQWFKSNRANYKDAVLSQMSSLQGKLPDSVENILIINIDDNISQLLNVELPLDLRAELLKLFDLQIQYCMESDKFIIFVSQFFTKQTLLSNAALQGLLTMLEPEAQAWLSERLLCLGGLLTEDKLREFLAQLVNKRELIAGMICSSTSEVQRSSSEALIECRNILKEYCEWCLLAHGFDYFVHTCQSLLFSADFRDNLKPGLLELLLEKQCADFFRVKNFEGISAAAYFYVGQNALPLEIQWVALKEIIKAQVVLSAGSTSEELAQWQLVEIYRFIDISSPLVRWCDNEDFLNGRRCLYRYLEQEKVLTDSAIAELKKDMVAFSEAEMALVHKLRLLGKGIGLPAGLTAREIFIEQMTEVYAFFHQEDFYSRFDIYPGELLIFQETLYKKLIAARLFSDEEACELRNSTVRKQLQSLVKQQVARITATAKRALKNNPYEALSSGLSLSFLFCDVDDTLIRRSGRFNGGDRFYFQRLFSCLAKKNIVVTGMTAREKHCGACVGIKVKDSNGKISEEEWGLEAYLGLQQQFNHVMTYLGASMPKAKAVYLFARMLLAELSMRGVAVEEINIGVWDDSKERELIQQNKIDELIAEDPELCDVLKVNLIHAKRLSRCVSYEDFLKEESVADVLSWAEGAEVKYQKENNTRGLFGASVSFMGSSFYANEDLQLTAGAGAGANENGFREEALPERPASPPPPG